MHQKSIITELPTWYIFFFNYEALPVMVAKPLCMSCNPTLLPAKTRFLFLLLITFQLVAVISNAQMRQVYKDAQAENEIRSLSFYSPSSGFAAFRDWIGFTADSGRSFVKKYINVGNVNYNGQSVNLTFGFHINGVKAFDQNTIIVYGHYGWENSILRSTDGGSTYTLVYHRPYSNADGNGITDVTFQNGTVGYAVDEDQILKTTNGGQSWFQLLPSAGSFWNHVQSVGSTVFAYSSFETLVQDGSNKLFKGTNNGSIWAQVTLPAGTLYAAHFLTDTRGWVIMHDGGVFQTTNAGASWIRQNPAAVPFKSFCIKFTNDQTGYALVGYAVFKTTDAGKIWEMLPRDHDFIDYSHNALQTFSNDQLWAGGGHGLLELTTNGGGVPYPEAYFSVDTTGLYTTSQVNLTNYSKTGYSFQWFKNDTLIGTSYHASYTRGAWPLRDTIMLIASNGISKDTATYYQEYHEPAYITSFTPVIAAAGATVTITGAHFTGAKAVYFGNVPASSFTVVNDQTIRAIVGAGNSGNVTVVTPGRGSAVLAGFTFLPPPVITSFTPVAATASSTITITGTGFGGITAVRIGGKPAISYTVVSFTTITAVVPSGGSGSIEVITNAGSAERTGFVAIPTLTTFTPAKGTAGTILTIKGTSLSEVTGIAIGGVPVQSFTILSPDSVRAIVGAGGTGSVALTAPGGNPSLPGFIWNAPPTITSFMPLSGPIGTSVTIIGTNFKPVAAENIVLFGTLRATVTAASTESLTVTVPAGATFQNISVTTNDLTAYSSRPFQPSFTGGAPVTPTSFTKTDINTEYPGSGGGRDYWDKAVGDLDGDGKQDLVITTSFFGASADILRNTSTANTPSFAPAQNFFLYGNAISLADLDGDGKSDIIRTPFNYAVDFAMNTSTTGNFSFVNAGTYSTPLLPSSQNIAVNDIDKDGKTDVVLASSENMIVFRNIGEPGILAFDTVMLRFGGYDLALADIDTDGKPDIIQFNPDTGSITVYKNNSTIGAVTFTPAVSLTANTPYAIAVADLDGDSRPDIVAGSREGNKIEVFRNTSTGSAITFADPRTYAMPGITYDVALADLDGDGKLDITASTDTYHFITFKNISTTGAVGFEAPVNHFPGTFSKWEYKFRITMSDLNADGRPDPVIIDKTVRARLSIYTNDALGKPFIREFTPAMAPANALVTIKGGYFTGATAVSFGVAPAASFTIINDSTIEARVGTGATGDVSITNQFGTSTKEGFVFGSIPFVTSFTPAAGPVGSQVTFSGSGFDPIPGNNIVYFGGVRATVAVATSTSLTVVVPAGAAPSGITITANNRTVATGKSFVVTFPGNGEAFSDTSFVEGFPKPGVAMGAIADIDQDGKNDFIGWRPGASMSIARNTSTPGSASFAPVLDFGPGENSVNAAAGDIDGDGKIDVAVLSAVTNTFHVFRNTTASPTNISFASKTSYTFSELILPGNGITIGDLDGDGRPEVITTSANISRVFVFKNLSSPGNIVLAPPLQYGINGEPISLTTDDVDNDGIQELMVHLGGLVFSGGVAVFKNTGPNGTLALSPAGGASADFPNKSVIYTDLDRDGKTDIISTTHWNSTVTINKNLSTPGNIQYSAQSIYFQNESFPYAMAGDLDGDGKPDLLYGGPGGFVFKNISIPGTIAWQERLQWPFIGPGLLVDVDGDGALDIMSDWGTFLNRMGRTARVQVCPDTDTLLYAGGTGTSYQWQQNTGSGFSNIQDNSHFSGTGTGAIQLNDIPASWNGYQFRCIINGTPNGRIYIIAMSTANTLPVVTIATPDSVICVGGSATFTAAPVNGGSTPSYQWQVNGMNVGQNANLFTTNTLTNGAQVKVIMTSSLGCVTPATDTSNIIPVTVSSSLTPSVIITASDTSLCSGEWVTFTATPVNGGPDPTFAWRIDGGVSGGNEETFSFSSSGVNDFTRKVTAVMRSSLSCASTYNFVYSNEIPVTFYSTANPSVSIVASTTTICPGANVTFTATPVNGGSTPIYQWQLNGVNVGQNTSTFSSNTLSDGDEIKVIMTSSSSCASTNTDTSNAIKVSVGTATAPSVTIAASATSLCAGTEVTFTATAMNAGSTPTYQWKVNGINAGQNVATFVTSSLSDSDEVSVVLTSSVPCVAIPTATSDTITVSVTAVVTPAVTITASETAICPGTKVYFTATPVNNGPVQQYLWYVNNVGVNGTYGNSFSSSFLNDGDKVHAFLTTNRECATSITAKSNEILISVNNSTTPSVSIAASATEICAGSNVTFTATPVYGGATPGYEWLVNDVNVWNNSNTFTTNNLKNGDEVRVIMVSNAECLTTNIARSDTITMAVIAATTPSVIITASATSICVGTNVTFNATSVNAGNTPAYQWQVNGVNAGQNSSTFSTNALSNGDAVKVILTSNSICTVTPTATSNVIPVSVSTGVVPLVSITASNTAICVGDQVTFTATPVNGGTTPVYQWRKNAAIVGTNSPVYADNTFHPGDVIQVVLTSNAACAVPASATSNAIEITAKPVMTPTITISGSVIVNEGSSSLITATIANAGGAPAYQWLDSTAGHSWQIIPGVAGATLDYTPAQTGDKVRCMLISNAPCVSPAIVASAVLVFTVNDNSGGRVAPNPVQSTLHIDGLQPDDQWEKVEIVNVNGGNKLVVRNVINQISVDIPVSHLAKGLYIAVFSNKKGDTMKLKFLKQ